MPNKYLKIFLLLIFFSIFGIAKNSEAATLYADNTLASDCTTGNYSIASRDCSGSDGNAYDTIQETIDNCNVGDTLYMRGGRFTEIDIDIPESKNGTAWTAGNFTTLTSYPGEWAIVDGTGLNTGLEYRYQHIFRHPTSYPTGTVSGATEYWLFEKFEVTGGRCGFWLTGGPMKFRYLYVHDNGRVVGDDIVGGIFIFTANRNILEYNTLINNEIPGAPSGNNFNLAFDGDYRDTVGNGGEFIPTASVHQNEIRYNYIEGSPQGIRLKGDQRFGYNNRDPRISNATFWDYSDYGDKIHHNILVNNDMSIRWAQDFSQIYNNISDTKIEPIGKWDGAPVLYNQCTYNNTVIGATSNYVFRSAGNDATYDNFYDVDGVPVGHIHVWTYNNIQSGYTDTLGAFRIMADASDDNWNAEDVVFDRNLVHSSTQTTPFRMGNTNIGTGCSSEYFSATNFNTCSNIWRGTTGVINWDLDGSLFIGVSGADKYKTTSSFVLGSDTIANAGIGGPHPYLPGVTIPSYIGATNPDDNDWVEGVLGLATISNLQNAPSGDPAWVEEAMVDSTSPSAPSGLSVL